MKTLELIDLPNLGSYTVHCLQSVDIHTVAQLRQLGAVQAYYRIYFHSTRKPSENLLWVLSGAIDNRHWKSYSHAEKEQLKALLKTHILAQYNHDELQA